MVEELWLTLIRASISKLTTSKKNKETEGKVKAKEEFNAADVSNAYQTPKSP